MGWSHDRGFRDGCPNVADDPVGRITPTRQLPHLGPVRIPVWEGHSISHPT